MMYQITNIEFDLSTDDDSIPQEHVDLVQQELQEEYIGTNWEADDEDDLIEEITCASGWCINSIDYVHVLK
jgi:adenine specific DNA methylase Mod